MRAGSAVATVLVAASLSGCQSVKDASIEIANATNAFVVSGGEERPAANGDALGKGDGVLTRAGGTVTLLVRGRRVVLGADTQVSVPDGATVDLARGALLVDRRRGPDVTVHAGDTTVDHLGEGAFRIEKSFSVLVSALSAEARVRTTTGPKLKLERLYQVVVAGRSLPRAGLPVQLRHDPWEKQVVADVLADDDHLNDLADGLKGPGAPAIPASYTSTGGVPVRDLVLADAIGRAAAKDETGRARAAAEARSLRAEGGSWGVVAHLLDASVVDVGAALSDVLHGIPASSPEPSASESPDGVVAGRSPQPGVTPSPSPSASRTKSPRPSNGTPTEEPTSESPTPGTLESLLSGLPSPLVDLLP